LLNKNRTSLKLGNKKVGYFEGDKFIKPVIGSKHLLKFPYQAWAIDAKVFDDEIKPNANYFIVRDRESGLEYSCTVKDFDNLKRTINRGYGKQYSLSLKHWKIAAMEDAEASSNAT
jgi:hypothetical protein